ncbi:MAG: PD40 domain-containing protein [Actinobacteria bacterium]|nr:PD40 domain-containing protein [Actinomycetota bacterium]
MRWLRLLGVAVALAPLPLAAATLSEGAPAARGLPRLAVSAREGDLWVGERQITFSGAEETEPDWSPDSRRIAFVRQEPSARGSSIFVVRRDGGDLRRLTAGAQVVAMPAWSPD